jgi:hypothetical protein
VIPAMAAASKIWCCSLLLFCTLALPTQAQAQRSAASRTAAATVDAVSFKLLGPDASAILAIQVSQVRELRELLLNSVPELRSTIDLAGLGVTAMLGWNIFDEEAWKVSGFDPTARLLARISAQGASSKTMKRPKTSLLGSRLWRVRMVIPASDPLRAKAALSKIRFRERSRLDDQGAKLATLLNLDARTAGTVQARLVKAGVFLVAKPKGMGALVLIAQRGAHFVIDLVQPRGPAAGQNPWPRHHEDLLRWLETKRKRGTPRGDVTNARAARDLGDTPLGLWLEPKGIAAMLFEAEFDRGPDEMSVGGKSACKPFVELANASHFSALSLRSSVATSAIHLQLRWHLRKRSVLPSVLRTKPTRLLAGSASGASNAPPLHALLRLDAPARLRSLPRPPVAQTWDRLWREAQACHPIAKNFAGVFAWPSIAGVFIDEVAALHSEAETLLSNLGGVAFTITDTGAAQTLQGEAWLRDPAPAIAGQWLDTLFGHGKSQQGFQQWGRGHMRPYLVSRKGGAVLGSNLAGPIAGPVAGPGLGESEKESRIFFLHANPPALQRGLLRHSIVGLLRSWQRLSAEITLGADALRFTIELKKD